MLVTKQLLVAIKFHSIFHTKESQWLPVNIIGMLLLNVLKQVNNNVNI